MSLLSFAGCLKSISHCFRTVPRQYIDVQGKFSVIMKINPVPRIRARLGYVSPKLQTRLYEAFMILAQLASRLDNKCPHT